jgi:hypothetical protein
LIVRVGAGPKLPVVDSTTLLALVIVVEVRSSTPAIPLGMWPGWSYWLTVATPLCRWSRAFASMAIVAVAIKSAFPDRDFAAARTHFMST